MKASVVLLVGVFSLLGGCFSPEDPLYSIRMPYIKGRFDKYLNDPNGSFQYKGGYSIQYKIVYHDVDLSTFPKVDGVLELTMAGKWTPIDKSVSAEMYLKALGNSLRGACFYNASKEYPIKDGYVEGVVDRARRRYGDVRVSISNNVLVVDYNDGSYDFQ